MGRPFSQAKQPASRGTALACFALLLLLMSAIMADAAKYCYSGQNDFYIKKHCSSGSLDIDYTCQKFTCKGGKSPFILRTCADKKVGCLAGPRICEFSKGEGSCSQCEGDLCN